MKPPAQPKWALTDEQRQSLRRALNSVPRNADASHPQFLKLLETWYAVKAPWNHWPVVKAYRCVGGEWVHGSVGEVVRAIRVHAGRP